MEMIISGELQLPNEKITIHVEGEVTPYSSGPANAYNDAKEKIIAAEEERRAKLDKEKEEQS